MRQVAGESPRRWFADAEMDLTVWIGSRGEITGFELCYDKPAGERALRWSSESGYSHQRIDDGEGRPGRFKGSPILLPDGEFPGNRISRLFEIHSREIERTIASYILKKINEYS